MDRGHPRKVSKIGGVTDVTLPQIIDSPRVRKGHTRDPVTSVTRGKIWAHGK
jgi:hypothetical protein